LKVLTSVTFTFNLFPSQVEGIVWASWSIGVEMLFYAIMPLLALLVRNIRQAVALFVATVLVAAAWHEAFKGASGTSEDFGYSRS
jgi:peptidoglycan/LPS O-acetylase OafA/YrhL